MTQERLDVLLVNAPCGHPIMRRAQAVAGLAPPWVGQLGAILKRACRTVAALDMRRPDSKRAALLAVLAERRPRVVGIGALTESFNSAVRIAALCRQTDPDIKVIVGGPHVTFTAEESLQTGVFDVVVRGEADETITGLAHHLIEKTGTLYDIRGLTYLEKGRTVSTPDQPLVSDLNSLPRIDRTLLPSSYYPTRFPLITSRGCPQQCFFCAAAALSGKRYRLRSVDAIINEIRDEFRDEDGAIKVLDDTFTAARGRTREFCRCIMNQGGEIKWACESRVDGVDYNTMALMREAGCIGIQFGVESGSQRILDSIRKEITVEMVRQRVAEAREVGIDITTSLMIGHPEDTEETIQETIKLACLLQNEGAAQVLFAISTPYPGTYLYRHFEELGLRWTSRNYDDFNTVTPTYETKYLTSSEIRAWHGRAAHAMMRELPARVREKWQGMARYIDENMNKEHDGYRR